MNYKRIISSLLCVVMLFAAVATLLPVKSEAAHSPSSVVGGTTKTADEISKIVTETYKYTYGSAAEMLEAELEKGYLDYASSAGNAYTIYVNRYTGVMYYVNNVTGEILTSNPYNLSGVADGLTQNQLMSQISIAFDALAGNADSPYHSSEWAAKRGQISVSRIANGLRVSYTLGDTATRYLIPGKITAARFFEEIITPLYERYINMLEEYYSSVAPEGGFTFFDNPKYSETAYEGEVYNHSALQNYVRTVRTHISNNANKTEYGKSSAEYKACDRLAQDFYNLLNSYQMINPAMPSFDKIPTYQEEFNLAGEPLVVYKNTGNLNSEASHSRIVKTYCPDYNLQEMYEDEAKCQFEYKAQVKPVFRCSLEYTLGADGSLTVRLPANSISFDETKFVLNEIKALPYFGAGNISKEGYAFLPDGSGSVTEFGDFYNANTRENASVFLQVYGFDYAYLSLNENRSYVEQVTMPVYGMISTQNAGSATAALTGKATVKNGFVAIIEEGATLATLQLDFSGATHVYGAVYSKYTPYPYDYVKVSGATTVAGESYQKFAEAKYTGSYVTRYTMLSDLDAQAAAGISTYEPTYSGMAHVYRDYLKGRGELTALENVGENLPLYIEALGSMDIVKKVLSFPVTASIPLTTFDDVVTMYDELANAKDKFLEKAAEYDALAAAEVEDLDLKASYEERAERYRTLSAELDNITNINFKLTGFANGGMYYSYPTRVKWEKACGGKRGFESLLNAAKDRTKDGANLGIYPDFDFLYMSNSAAFDGISNSKNLSKMIDNRYASRQTYNTIKLKAKWEPSQTLVISADTLGTLYNKFIKKYSKYSASGISLSTMGSDVNSNFNVKNTVSREEAKNSIVSMLESVSNDYSVMLDKGNAYTFKYADHILDVPTDSSYYKFSSYNVPFLGMVLHGYVNYAGTPINYTGDPDYDILHAIENGASLSYILCYNGSNTGYMKDDELLSDYFGVQFDNWFDDVVIQYNKINSALRTLQTYEIVKHEILLAERIINADERAANNRALAEEFILEAESALKSAIAAAYDEMRENDANIGLGLKVTVDFDALIAVAKDMLNLTDEELVSSGLSDALETLKSSYESEYCGVSGKDSVELTFNSVAYESKYEYTTDSFATDGADYVYTDFTVDNRLVTRVTYRDAASGDEVQFIINYNIYGVNVRLSDGTVIEVGATSFYPVGLN